MIDKKIHYIWVGGNPLTKLARKCIKSWRKYCPDYEIILWNEDNFDVSQNKFCKQAYDAKKWAFVSDYMRMKILYDHGGIYMDADVEVLKPLDEFLHHQAFSGFERTDVIPTGIIAAQKGNPWIKSNLDWYNNTIFEMYTNDNMENMLKKSNVWNITEITQKMYPEFILNNETQHLKDVSFYEKVFFCPLTNETGEVSDIEKSYTIHHFAGSWLPRKSLFKRSKNILKHLIGVKRIQKRKYNRQQKNRINAIHDQAR